MNILHDVCIFRKGIHQLALISTDLAEAESLVKGMAEEEKQRNPADFAGKQSCVYFKFPYVPPCDSFNGLRSLILRVQENTGLRANFKGIVAIEATEWLGHEKEDYFTVLLKFLYDHRDTWRAAFVLNNSTPVQIQRFLSACACYITPRLYDLKIFADPDRLCGIVQEVFAKRGTGITHEAAEMLAAAMRRPELKDARSLTLIERTVEEVLSSAENGKEASVKTIQDYLINPYSTLTMMAGKPLWNERSMTFGNESLQL